RTVDGTRADHCRRAVRTRSPDRRRRHFDLDHRAIRARDPRHRRRRGDHAPRPHRAHRKRDRTRRRPRVGLPPANHLTSTEEPLPPDAAMSPSRLAQFEAEVTKLKVTGGGANPERTAERVGIGITITGFVIAFISWWSAYNASRFEDIHRAAIFALIGVGIA